MKRLKSMRYDEQQQIMHLEYRSGRIRRLKDVTPVMAMRLIALLRKTNSGCLALISALI